MNSELAIGALTALLLAGCQSAAMPPPPVTTPYTLNEAETNAVKEGVRRSLKDPTSALFGETFRASQKDPGVVYVCGVVNGKNSFGGYAGDRPFLGLLATMKDGKISTFNVTSIGSDDISTSTVMDLCRHYGVI